LRQKLVSSDTSVIRLYK